jgi:hypothetical protein
LAIGRAAPKKSLSTDESEEIWETRADAGARAAEIAFKGILQAKQKK